MSAASVQQSLLLVLVACLAMVSLSGCDSRADVIDNIKREAVKEWERVEHSKAIQSITGRTRDAFHELEKASKAGARDAEQKALEAVRAVVRELYSTWRSAMKPLEGTYVISPKCLLAMAVGGGAVTAASGLGLAALGFAEEGVEAESLAALWQSSLGDVKAGSLFSRLQSLGAKGLSTSQKFEITGTIVSASVCFCGVVNDLCHHCISGLTHDIVMSNATAPSSETNQTSMSGVAHDLAMSNTTATSSDVNQIVF
mmetsp:Transcript_92246/g.206225  ORF Transcript_92246/g.206225 Transcript_92246/m.206225 type:complete len:256 (+) Transcript_92246:66-833(+)